MEAGEKLQGSVTDTRRLQRAASLPFDRPSAGGTAACCAPQRCSAQLLPRSCLDFPTHAPLLFCTQVHGDVFRPPNYLELLSAFVGTGMQLALLVLSVILITIAGGRAGIQDVCGWSGLVSCTV